MVGGPFYHWLGASADAETGSREPRPQAVDGPSGFDPARKRDRQALEAWAFNVLLETQGRENAEAIIGGAVLPLADLYRILCWARRQAGASQ